jgi:co-chaperonin GroES (HSP10)
MSRLFLFTTLLSTTHAFVIKSPTTSLTVLSMAPPPSVSFQGGAGVGRLILEDNTQFDYDCHYDMVLVERLPDTRTAKTTAATTSATAPPTAGLYIPPADLPKLHLARVLSVGPGKEEEDGRLVPTSLHLQPGVLVVAKNPWGIGPKDEETLQGQKWSFMRSQDVAAVVIGELIE